MNFELRKWTLDDVPSVVKHASNEKIAANLTDGFHYPYTLEDAKAFVESCINSNEEANKFRAISIDGVAVGSVAIAVRDDIYRKTGELGYWLGEEYWGQGIMSAAVIELCRQAFEDLDVVRIYSQPFAYNTGSRRVLEKAGFTLEGIMKNGIFKRGQVMDNCMYALIK